MLTLLHIIAVKSYFFELCESTGNKRCYSKFSRRLFSLKNSLTFISKRRKFSIQIFTAATNALRTIVLQQQIKRRSKQKRAKLQLENQHTLELNLSQICYMTLLDLLWPSSWLRMFAAVANKTLGFKPYGWRPTSPAKPFWTIESNSKFLNFLHEKCFSTMLVQVSWVI